MLAKTSCYRRVRHDKLTLVLRQDIVTQDAQLELARHECDGAV